VTPLLGFLLLFAQGAGNPIVSPPSVTQTHVDVTVQAPPPDPAAIADASVQSTNAIIMQVVAPIIVDLDNQLFNLPDFFRHTPDDLTWNNSQIRGLADLVRKVALALLALAIFVYGLTAALRHRVDGWKRLVLGTILSIGDLIWWQWGIQLNNAINDSIGAPDLPSLIRPHIALNASTGQLAANVVLVIVYAVVALLVMLSLLFRLGLIQVLIAIGPLALFCAATEQTEHFANKYITLSVGLLFSQVMIVLGMKVAQVDAAVGAGIAGTFMAMVVLLLIRGLPTLVASTASAGHSAANRIATAIVTRRVTGVFR
jgi:hypothetical protein